MNRPLDIAFVHPDLGLGGAERLVVDAAAHLRTAGHRVTIFTAHHDSTRCFEETSNGTLDVRVYGDFLPMHVANRLRAVCSIARMAYLAGATALRRDRFDVIFCDLVSHALPLFRLFHRCPIVFYCHFPDQILAPRRGFPYRLYRAPIDWLEAVTTTGADRILVNSHFTAAAFRRTFPRARSRQLEVLHPGVDCEPPERGGAEEPRSRADAVTPPRNFTILSLNRYDPGKNLGLAVEALAALRERIPASRFAEVQLVIAGGYDDRLIAQRHVLRDLQELAGRLGVAERVVFRRSVSDAERLQLLHQCHCVVYTPVEEHFGLVPLEAMAADRPVVAANSGGVLETVLQGETGLLCPPIPAAFADALAKLIGDPDSAARMGRAGRRRVQEQFSRAAFGARLESVLWEVAGAGGKSEARRS